MYNLPNCKYIELECSYSKLIFSPARVTQALFFARKRALVFLWARFSLSFFLMSTRCRFIKQTFACPACASNVLEVCGRDFPQLEHVHETCKVHRTRDHFLLILWSTSLSCGKISSEYLRDFEIFYHFSLTHVSVIATKRSCSTS